MANTLKFGNGQWATGNGTVLAYNDENSNFKPIPFDFTRASSGTVVNQSGLIETVGSGIPRIDFQGNTKGALLLEPSRTNSLPYSEDFSTWSTASGASVVGNKLGIGGSNDAFEFLSDGSASTRLFYSVSNTGELSFSVFAKKNTLDYIALYGNGGANPRVWFNLANGTLGNQEGAGTGSIESYGNGWYRCTMYWTSASLVNVRIYNSNENDVFGGTAGSVFIQYSQLEAGSYATSYIPTSGSAVTRVADSPFQREDLASKNLIGSTELTWFYDCILFNKETGTSVAPRIGSSTNNQIFIGINVPANNSTDLRIRHKEGTTAANTSSFPFTNGGRFKVAIKISGTTGSAYINGTNVGTFTTVAAINYNQYNNAINNPNNINDMRVYNTALTDQELIALTQV